MILPESLGDSLWWIVESFIVVIALVWRFRPPKRWWGHLLMLGGMIACFFGGFRVAHAGSHVVIVKIGSSGHPVEKTRGRLYFGKSYAMQNGAMVRLVPAESDLDCVIVNDSSQTLRLEAQQYATTTALALPKSDPETIARFTVKPDGPTVDAIGPDEALPPKTEGVLNETFLFHLTWGASGRRRTTSE